MHNCEHRITRYIFRLRIAFPSPFKRDCSTSVELAAHNLDIMSQLTDLFNQLHLGAVSYVDTRSEQQRTATKIITSIAEKVSSAAKQFDPENKIPLPRWQTKNLPEH
ncbi:MAG TPA: hypothetical protein VIS99_12115 [Terrimicrobiaceae bacterium]